METKRIATFVWMSSAGQIGLSHNSDDQIAPGDSEISGLTFYASRTSNGFTDQPLNYHSTTFTHCFVFGGDAEFSDYAIEHTMGDYVCSPTAGTSRYFKNCSPVEQTFELTEEAVETKLVSASQVRTSGYSLSVGITKGMEVSIGATVGASALFYSGEASLDVSASVESSTTSEYSSSYEKSNSIEFGSEKTISETISLVLSPQTTTIYTNGEEVCTRDGVYYGCLDIDCDYYILLDYEETVTRTTHSISVSMECA
eukprot:CAMPEP_0117014796 /NCGR_PEP_ID=MMETSP0472-20121206/11936_1 /TAXON_ID=693140 ORGANISM="Tiarina fusus, Strain LIS" /NCGR_SAMPLE_ID=MMETSP0472 /ASSEMBLY_ACC=CAM_ASM_000603 /LENGTH=255 /DNA_ID=CAMNT_0004718443 /DNA_START=336 /DNA_END=1103 /DNA_ORIENTATION=-